MGHLAVGESSVILLCPPLLVAGGSIQMERESARKMTVSPTARDILGKVVGQPVYVLLGGAHAAPPSAVSELPSRG